jgi:phospho-N-acetylmuramoyl-pentapeptide-transferase
MIKSCYFQIQEKARREDAPALDQFQTAKHGTPTMGGILIVGSILVSSLLWADLSNRYILMTMLTCSWLAILGFMDDYIKLVHSMAHVDQQH